MTLLVTHTLSSLATMFEHPFMQRAFLAGTAVALAAGLAGYFAVLRGQVFTGDALSHVAVTGALAALALGVDLRLGLVVATVAVAIGMGLLGRRGTADDVVTGSVFAWVLGLGVLFLSVYTTHRSTTNGAAGVSVLFGSIFGLSDGVARLTALVGLGVCAALIAIARPLLFASLDQAVAAAQRVPVRALGLGFLALLGLAAAEATPAVGALLLLGLLATPAATAQRLTDHPFRAFWLSGALAVAAMWAGLTLSYVVPKLPPSFAVVASAAGVYAAVIGATTLLQMMQPHRPLEDSLENGEPSVPQPPLDRRQPVRG
jgi:zinc/manganese transport system permease protein